MSKNAKIKSALTPILKLVFAGGMIYWIIAKGGFRVDEFMKLATPAYISIVFLLLVANIFLNNRRWQILLHGQGIDASFWELMRLTFIGLFFNFAMPGGVGGDVVKAYYLVKSRHERRATALLSVLMDRIVGFFAMTIVAAIVLLFHFDEIRKSPHLTVLSYMIFALFLGFVTFFAISFSRRVGKSPFMHAIYKLPGGRIIKKLYEDIHAYRKSPGALVQSILMSFGSQSLAVVIFIATGRAMGLDVPVATYFYVVPLGLIAQSIPVSPGGVGLGQAAFYFLFNWSMNQETQLGPNGITVMQIMTLLLASPGVFFYLRQKKHLPQEIVKA